MTLRLHAVHPDGSETDRPVFPDSKPERQLFFHALGAEPETVVILQREHGDGWIDLKRITRT